MAQWRGSALRPWAAAAVIVPFVSIASSFLPAGVTPLAEACVPPATITPGVTALNLGQSDITVGRDGFFVFSASGVDATEAMARSAVDVEVTNAAGALVPGDVAIMLFQEHERPDSNVFWLSWEARDALPAGARFSLRVSLRGAGPLAALEGTLDVVDATAGLASSEFEFSDWQALLADTGPKLTCTPKTPGWCGPIEFGSNVERVLSASVRAETFSRGVPILWEYKLSEVPGKGTLAEPLGPTYATGEVGELGFHPLFREKLDQYCVEITVRDLRTDETLRDTYCGSPPPAPAEVDGDPIQDCLTVPPEYLERWCDRRGPSFDPSCPDPGAGGSSGFGGGGDGPSAGTGSHSAGGGGMPPTAGAAALAGASATDDDDSGARTVITDRGCGCRVAPRAAGQGWLWLAALATCGLVSGRRRGKTGPRMRMGGSGQDHTGVLYLWGPDATRVSAEASQPVTGDLVILKQFEENDTTMLLLDWTASGAARAAGETLGRDLKSGVTKSGEVCASPVGELPALVDDRVGDCLEPPAGLEKRWCAAIGFHTDTGAGDDVSAEDRATRARLLGAGAGGAGGDAGNPPAAGGGAEEPVHGGAGGGGAPSEVEPDAGSPPASAAGAPNLPEVAAEASRKVTDRGCACRTAADPDGREATLVFTGLVVGLGLRRRIR